MEDLQHHDVRPWHTLFILQEEEETEVRFSVLRLHLLQQIVFVFFGLFFQGRVYPLDVDNLDFHLYCLCRTHIQSNRGGK